VPPVKTANADLKMKSRAVDEARAARRRVPGWLVVLASMALAGGYGVLFEKMPFGPPLVMLGLGGMTLALCGMALWRVIDPLTRPEGAAARHVRAPQRLRELEREKQLVLKAIKEVELDHQMRKIADVDYREMIERYRTRAMRLISEIEVGDNFRELIERELKDRLAVRAAVGAEAAAVPAASAPEATAATTTAADTTAIPRAAGDADAGCASCGAINDDDARFCKKCGAKIEQPEQPAAV
jgi:hypothetical protein